MPYISLSQSPAGGAGTLVQAAQDQAVNVSSIDDVILIAEKLFSAFGI